MSNVINTSNCPELDDIRALSAKIIGHNNLETVNENEDTESYEVSDIEIDDNDLVLFKAPISQAEYIQVSELQNNVYDIFSQIFADCFQVKFTYDTNRGFVFVCGFNFIPDDQFKDKEEDNSKTIRVIDSSINPDEISAKNGIAANLILMIQNQNINSYDASKYAKISLKAKGVLKDLLWCSKGNPKRKWVSGENYTLTTQSGIGFTGGRSFTNIIGTVFLDAERVISLISQTKEDKGKFEYKIVPLSNNISNTDSLLKLEKVSKARKRQVSNKYGINFTK